MLSIQLKDGEYFTIGEDIVVQVLANSVVKVLVNAPKDLPIVRGEVLERNGEDRPSCLICKNPSRKPRKQVSNG